LNFFTLYPGARLVDLPGYGYADVPAAQRRTWPPLIEALRERESLRGLFVIVDARRGLKPGDADLLAWASPAQRVHVLLSKADKLNKGEGAAALKAAGEELGERATVQLFSALRGTGVREAEDTLEGWLRA
jgi:GTP-binding protein